MTRAAELANMCAVKIMHSDYKTAKDLEKIILIAVSAAQQEERKACAEVVKDMIRNNWKQRGELKGLTDAVRAIEGLK